MLIYERPLYDVPNGEYIIGPFEATVRTFSEVINGTCGLIEVRKFENGQVGRLLDRSPIHVSDMEWNLLDLIERVAY